MLVTTPMKITAYKMVCAHVGNKNEALEKVVNDLIKEGWQPFGSPSILPPTPELNPQSDIAYQAMVRGVERSV